MTAVNSSAHNMKTHVGFRGIHDFFLGVVIRRFCWIMGKEVPQDSTGVSLVSFDLHRNWNDFSDRMPIVETKRLKAPQKAPLDSCQFQGLID